MLTVTDAADDLQLLTPEELRRAAGIEADDPTYDAELAVLGLRASTALAAACGVARAGYAASYLTESPPLRGEAPVTLKAEGLTETIRGQRHNPLFLARRPVLSVTSVQVSGSLVSDYEVDIPQGALYWTHGFCYPYWDYGCANPIVVSYEAGYDIVPQDLKGYASRLVSTYYQTFGEDPNVRRYEIPDVVTVERWVDTSTDSIVPEDIMTGLIRDGYRKPALW